MSRWLGALLCFMALLLCLQSGAAAPALNPLVSGGVFGLEWNPDAGVLYRIQSSTDLSSSNGWTTEDLVSGSNSVPLRWMAPESLLTSKFYRLALPEPEILDVEPAIVTAGEPVTFYILGQNFSSNDVLRIGPRALTNRIVISPNLIEVTFTPDVPGDYGFALDSALTGKTSDFTYSWTLVAPGGSRARLEPPSRPVAAPGRTAIKQKVMENPVGEMRDYEKEPAHVEVPNLCLFSGELQSSAVDLFIPGRGLDFIWKRTYRSSTGGTTALGAGWDFSYNVSVQLVSGNILLHGGEGRDDTLFDNGSGLYLADGWFVEGTLSNNVFRLTFADSGYWEFFPFDGSATAGKLARSVDRNGNTMSFGYDTTGRLSAIVDDLGRPYTVAYNSSGQLSSLTDFAGRTVTYSYYPGGTAGGSAGDLASVTTPAVTNTPNGNDFPTGKTTSFTYTTGFSDDRLNHNLGSVHDSTGQVWLQVFYHTNTNPADLDYDAVDYVQRGASRIHLSRYAQTASPDNQYATVKAIVTDGVGNVSECFYDARNRCVRRLDYTGRANPDLPTTETDNRPQGKLRAGDPDYYETRWEWNPDSLCTRVTLPDGEVTEALYERAFNQNASRSNHRMLANLRVLHHYACCGGADTDGDGVPDLSLRSWYFDYDPRFGAPLAECSFPAAIDLPLLSQLDGPASRKAINTKGTGATLRTGSGGSSKPGKGSGGITSLTWPGKFPVVYRKWEGDVLDFAIRVTDPRRLTTYATYDAHGNCVQTRSADYFNDPQNGKRLTEAAYNTYGQLTGITNAPDANGYRRVDAATYYTTGPQAGYCATWTVDTQGPTLTLTSFEYDERGNLTRCVDPRGNDTLVAYNALDQCMRCQSPTNLTARCTTDYFYDANNNLVQQTVEVRDANDTLSDTRTDFWSFNPLNLCTSHAEQVSGTHFITNNYAYDGNDNLALVMTPEAVNGNDPTNVLLYAYDERNLLFQAVHAPTSSSPGTNQWDYDANGRCITITVGACGANKPSVSLYAYDGFGRCVTVTDPMGNVCTRAYDPNDNLVYENQDGEDQDVEGGNQNHRLNRIRYAYDAADRCVAAHQDFFDSLTQLPLGDGDASTLWTYAPNGQLTSVTDDNGHKTQYSYDTLGRLAGVTDPKGNTVAYTYDACGNALTATTTERSDLGGAPQVFVCYNGYDNLNRCVTASDNTGNTNHYAYDSLSRCVQTRDAYNNPRGRAYDLLGRCTLAVADLDGDGKLDFAKDAGRAWAYDDNSRCVATTDANGNTTAYAYDSQDRCVQVTNPDGTTARLIWSPRSNLTSEQDPNGTVMNNTYDLLDRCVRCDITPAAGVATTTTFETFTYDGCSRLVAAANDGSSCAFSYDSLGDCVSTKQDGLLATYSYDGVGNCVKLVYPSGRVVTYTYDALDEVTSLNTAASGGLPSANLAQYAYDGPGRIARITRANGINTRVVWNGLVSPPNASGDFGWRQVAGYNHQVAGGGTVIDRRNYTYDPNQNKTLRAQLTPWVQGGDTETNIFSYDPLNRLDLAINSRGSSVKRTAYALDAQGNRLAVTNNGVAALYSRDATLPEPADFQMDQYTLTPFGSQLFDHNGNLLQRSSATALTQYQYDYADRLVEVDSMEGTGTLSPLVSFTYDALGRRISKTVYPPSPLAPVTTVFVNDCDDHDPHVLEQWVSGKPDRAYCLAADLDGDGWPDRVAFTASGQAQYYHGDELGNVLALTDAKGAVLERYSYDDYGQPSFLSSDGSTLVDSHGLLVTASSAGNDFLFQGMFWDGESGLYCKDYCPAEEQLKGNPRHCPTYVDPASGRMLWRMRKRPELLYQEWGRNAYTFSGDNPWSASIAIDEQGVHREKIIHRDLACRNLLLRSGSSPKISDFGMSRFHVRQEFGPSQATRKLRASTKTQGDFNLANRFSLEIDGVLATGVHSIDGLDNETDLDVTIRPPNHCPSLVGKASAPPRIRDWIKSSFDNRVGRKSISVIFHNDAGEEAGRLNFYQCWPTKWQGPSLNARNSGHATEKLEISWEQFDWK